MRQTGHNWTQLDTLQALAGDWLGGKCYSCNTFGTHGYQGKRPTPGWGLLDTWRPPDTWLAVAGKFWLQMATFSNTRWGLPDTWHTRWRLPDTWLALDTWLAGGGQASAAGWGLLDTRRLAGGQLC